MLVVTERMFNIIKILAANEGFPLSSGALAGEIGCSSRTIKRDLAGLIDDQLLPENGFMLTSGPKGYVLQITDQELYRVFFENLERTFKRRETRNKTVFSIMKLLLVNECITQEKMAEQLFVSRSTLSKYIPDVKLILEAKGIVLSSAPHYGYFIEGNERDIRNYMVSILFSAEDLTAAEPELLHVLPLDLDQLAGKVAAILSENDFKLPERNLNNLLCYLAVGIVRIQNGKHIKFERNSALKVDKKTYRVCEELLGYLEDRCSLRFEEQEKRYLAYLLIGSSYRGEIPSDGQMNVFFEEMTDEMFFRIRQVYDVDFSTDEILRKGLIQHIYSAFHRFQLHISVGNPLISLIKSQYIEAYNYSVLCCSILQDSYYFNITEDDIGYVALHFAAAMERSSESEHYRVIAVCGGSFGTYNLLRAKLSRYLPNISIVDICSSFEICSRDLTDIDFIIHMAAPNYSGDLTLPARHSGQIPVVTVNELLTEEDIATITDCINHFNDFAYLQSLFRKELFLGQLEVESKQGALEQITNVMLEEGYITAGTKEAIFRREMVSTTEINELVAIPHSILPLELQSVIGVAILKEPLEWGHGQVQLILAGAINPSIQVSKKVFLLLYKLTRERRKVEQLVRMNDFDEFIKLLFSDIHIVG